MSLISIIIARSIVRPLEKTFLLENAIKQSTDGIAVSDLDGSLQFVNDAWAKMHGYSVEELTDKNVDYFHTEKQQLNKVARYQKMIDKLGAYSGELNQKRKGDSIFPALVSTSLLTDTAGTPCNVIIIARDITEGKKAEKALQAAQKELVEKAHKAGMADIATGTLHNVGNILNSVKTSAQVVSEVLGNSSISGLKKANSLLRENIERLDEFILHNPKGKKLMQHYLKLEEGFAAEHTRTVKHIDRLSDKIDAIAEVIAAQQSYAGTSALTEEYNLSEIVEDALIMQSGSTERYNIAIETKFNKIPKVPIQRTKFIHILINLIKNARESIIEAQAEERKTTVFIETKENHMLGAIAGDVIGSVFERYPTKSTDFSLFTHNSTFTDDTALTIALAWSILNGTDYTSSLKTFGQKYPNAGYGGLFYKWMFSSDSEPYNSWGNGSAMRVSPVGFAFTSIKEVLNEAKKSAEVTHNHPEGIKGAQAIALAIFLARTGERRDTIKKEISSRFGYNLDRTIDEIRKTYHFDVSCQGSVPEAIIAFFEAENYEDTIRLAISLGGDSDTQACMAGGIAQAFYGQVPPEIASKVRERLPKEFLSIIDEFYKEFGLYRD